MIVSHVEFVSFDELGAEISWIKGGPGSQTGGTPSRQSGGHLSPGGEIFAPHFENKHKEHPGASRITLGCL